MDRVDLKRISAVLEIAQMYMEEAPQISIYDIDALNEARGIIERELENG